MAGRSARTGVARAGFTLVELLTVIAIIAVLATLTMTALSSAKRKARQAGCTSNLRQISLALNMYLDDQEKRPSDLTVLVTTKYLAAPGALRCLEDRTGNWGGLVENSPPPAEPPLLAAVPPSPVTEVASTKFAAPAAGAAVADPAPTLLPYSYLHPLPWDDWAWKRLAAMPSGAGIAVCQLHGLGKPNLDAPSIQDYEGLVLRAQRDGAVVRRQVFWDRAPAGARLALDAAAAVSATNYPWRLFTDEPAP